MTESATAVDPQNTNDEAVADVARAAEESGRASGRKKAVKNEELAATKPLQAIAGGDRLDLLSNIEMDVTAELGRTRMTVRELLSLTPGTVVELDRMAGSPIDLYVNGTLIARGEVVVIDEEFGVRISEIVTPGAVEPAR
ncbi:MAG: flagellar motor switch protein FliN [Acidothermaceae bacterium]